MLGLRGRVSHPADTSPVNLLTPLTCPFDTAAAAFTGLGAGSVATAALASPAPTKSAEGLDWFADMGQDKVCKASDVGGLTWPTWLRMTIV